VPLVLYDAARCPYCARVRIVLAEKAVEHEPVAIDLSDRPDWIYEKNPTGKVPVLEEDDGFVLPESAVIMEYLEERYPEPALLPGDSHARALARVWIDRFDARLGDVYYAVRRGDAELEALEGKFAGLDRALASRPYLTGDEFGLADIAYAPWILRAQANLGASIDGFDALSDWLERLTARPAVGAEVEVVEALAG
jgi:pyrimidodiazepine synthase